MASSTSKGHPPATAPEQPALSSSFPSSSAAQLPEDESRRKNTDCVYFLASPLTCKKGSECEYRHSEYARVNHRDCWFWLNGNCLNPKCSFRHPPLDTLLGPPVDGSAGSSVPDSSGAAAVSSLPPLHTVPSAPYIAAKPTVPCIFFQKGYCLKGDRCPFLHMPNPTSKKTPEFPAVTVSGSSSLNNASGELKKCSQQKIVPQANVSRPIEVTASQPKTSVHAVKAMPRNGPFAEKCGTQPIFSNEDLPKHRENTLHTHNNGNKPGSAPQVSSLIAINKSGSALQASSLDEQQRFQSGKEADDLLRESSPGFDVLVDDELRGADYYGNEDQFPRIQGREGRNLNEFEIGHPDCYSSVDDVDPVIYRDRYGYDKYESKQEKRARDHHRTPSERSIIEGSHCDRRGVYNGVNPDRKENSDLRHRLSKVRRINGLSSVLSPDYASDGLAEEHGYRSFQRDSHQALPCAGSFSSRLQGRIKLPRQSSPVNPPSMRSERENDKGRNRLRLSPSRPQLQSHQGKLHDRLRGRVQDNIGRDATARRDLSDYESSDFVAPKSLAELKKAKQSHIHSREPEPLKRGEEFTSVGKRKALESSQHTEDDLSFEGPKPLSEILKRKKKAEATDSQNGAISGIEEENKNSEHKEIAAVEKQETNQEESKLSKGPVIAAKQEANLPTHVSVKNPGAAEESGAEGLDLNDKTKLAETETSLANNELEGEEEGLATDGVEDHELEQYYEEGDEGYEEEQDDGGEAYDEGEGGGMPDDHMDEDDGDNFAKKIGVIFG